jgi:GGDEF domain-containing protein
MNYDLRMRLRRRLCENHKSKIVNRKGFTLMSAVNKNGTPREVSPSGISRYPNARKILLVGDVEKAFLDADAASDTHIEVCADMQQAIRLWRTARQNFAAIAIIMSGISARLSSDLKALRDPPKAGDAKIILLAQMYEEPIAIHLVNSIYNDLNLADDYLICPVKPDTFYESISTAGRPKTTPREPTSWRGRPGLESHRHPFDKLRAVSTGREEQRQDALATSTETRIRYLERLATEDDLTGLKNRRYIWEFSRQIIEYAKKENGRVTLLVFDVDDLKKYNDIYGHHAGDEILKQAAMLMRRCCRGHDVVGRVGGDEFAVIFWDDPQSAFGGRAELSQDQERRSAHADHPAEAITIAKRFVKELSTTGLSTELRHHADFDELGPEGKGVLTISGGLASFPRDGQTIEELFLQADKALLEAKRSGKNRIYLVGKPQSNINEIE